MQVTPPRDFDGWLEAGIEASFLVDGIETGTKAISAIHSERGTPNFRSWLKHGIDNKFVDTTDSLVDSFAAGLVFKRQSRLQEATPDFADGFATCVGRHLDRDHIESFTAGHDPGPAEHDASHDDVFGKSYSESFDQIDSGTAGHDRGPAEQSAPGDDVVGKSYSESSDQIDSGTAASHDREPAPNLPLFWDYWGISPKPARRRSDPYEIFSPEKEVKATELEVKDASTQTPSNFKEFVSRCARPKADVIALREYVDERPRDESGLPISPGNVRLTKSANGWYGKSLLW